MKRVTIELEGAAAEALASQSRLAGFASPDAYLAALIDADRLRLERLRVEAELRRDAEANPRPPMTDADCSVSRKRSTAASRVPCRNSTTISTSRAGGLLPSHTTA